MARCVDCKYIWWGHNLCYTKGFKCGIVRGKTRINLFKEKVTVKGRWIYKPNDRSLHCCRAYRRKWWKFWRTRGVTRAQIKEIKSEAKVYLPKVEETPPPPPCKEPRPDEYIYIDRDKEKLANKVVFMTGLVSDAQNAVRRLREFGVAAGLKSADYAKPANTCLKCRNLTGCRLVKGVARAISTESKGHISHGNQEHLSFLAGMCNWYEEE